MKINDKVYEVITHAEQTWDKPIGLVYFAHKVDDVLNIGSRTAIDLDDWHTPELLQKICDLEGFRFFLTDKEGEQYIKDNKDILNNVVREAFRRTYEGDMFE